MHGVSHENERWYVNQTITWNGMERLVRVALSQALLKTYGQGESQERGSARNSVRTGADGTNARSCNERLCIQRTSAFLFQNP